MRDSTLRAAKANIREYLKLFTDNQLVKLLDDARAEKVPYGDCKTCLVGHRKRFFMDREHLRGWWDGETVRDWNASSAHGRLGRLEPDVLYEDERSDPLRQRRLVPLVRSEINRRVRAAGINLRLIGFDRASGPSQTARTVVRVGAE